MACVPIPTETLYDTVITTEQSTSVSDSITTVPPVVTTIVSTSCSAPVSDVFGGGDCVDVPVTVVSTIDGMLPYLNQRSEKWVQQGEWRWEYDSYLG